MSWRESGRPGLMDGKRNSADEEAHSCSSKACRICLLTEDECSSKLISPCGCSGTSAHVHLDCLRKWQLSSGSQLRRASEAQRQARGGA